jgi:transcriptional regulator with XRE-family HTH domain
MKKNTKKNFGERLASIRKEKGITQAEFARKIGISRRAMAYYEVETDKMPDGELLLKMAEVLEISIDQLLGVKPLEQKQMTLKEARTLNKLKKVLHLPEQDQKTVLRVVDSLVQANEN